MHTSRPTQVTKQATRSELKNTHVGYADTTTYHHFHLSAPAMKLFVASLLLLASAATATAAGSWRSDLPWAVLESQLASPDTSLIDTSNADFIDQCTSEFLDKPDPYTRTNHALIEQPSGLCMSTMFCAYVGCNPNPSGGTNVTLADRIGELNGPEGPKEEVFYWALDPTNPSFNLPSKVLFPSDATDVIAAVNFARTNGLELSVKNSGHSYLGASTKRDTLLVNMMQFPRYATTSITDCTTTTAGSTSSSTASTGTASEDFDDQPCTLAVARGKPAYVRVGGGENFDKLYRAVRAFNDEADGEGRGFQYTVLGGGAGTVSPSKSGLLLKNHNLGNCIVHFMYVFIYL